MLRCDPNLLPYKIRMLRLPVECEKLILGGNAARLILNPHLGRRQSAASMGIGFGRDAPRLIRRAKMTTLGERRVYYS